MRMYRSTVGYIDIRSCQRKFAKFHRARGIVHLRKGSLTVLKALTTTVLPATMLRMHCGQKSRFHSRSGSVSAVSARSGKSDLMGATSRVPR